MPPDERQIAHSEEMKLERGLQKLVGVTRSQARDVLKGQRAEDRLQALSRIGRVNRAPTESPKIQVVETKLDKAPLNPPSKLPNVQPQGGGAAMGPRIQVDFVAVEGELVSILVFATIVVP